MTLVERLRGESQTLFPERMRDGHSYHSTAMILDKAADALETAEKALERCRHAQDCGVHSSLGICDCGRTAALEKIRSGR